MIAAFDFEEDGRSFSCCVETVRCTQSEEWWWFGVSGETQRYAPFHAAPSDTEANVRARVAEYYADLLERRARPVPPRAHWARRGAPAAAETPPVAAPVAASATS